MTTARGMTAWMACAMTVAACADHRTPSAMPDAATPDAATEEDAAVDCGVLPHEAGSVDPDRINGSIEG